MKTAVALLVEELPTCRPVADGVLPDLLPLCKTKSGAAVANQGATATIIGTGAAHEAFRTMRDEAKN